MTNAEKYLKDGVDFTEVARLIDEAYKKAEGEVDVAKSTLNWLTQQAKFPLTEDEKVILKNTSKEFKSIMRNEYGNLKLITNISNYYDFWAFNGLFQFIKNGEEYSIKELLKEEMHNERGRLLDL